MLEIKLTQAFEESREAFLVKHLGNRMLESVVKRLIRNLANVELHPDNRWGQYNISTPFIGKGYRKLGCVYVVNLAATAISPYLLYFPYMQAGSGWPDSTFAQMAKVMDELGW